MNTPDLSHLSNDQIIDLWVQTDEDESAQQRIWDRATPQQRTAIQDFETFPTRHTANIFVDGQDSGGAS